jgi:Putative auto-transporter adhesin, head GIN domain
MMRTITLLLVVALAGVANGCRELGSAVRGSGNRIMQKREIGEFKTLSTEGAFDIRVICQKAPSLQIEGDDNILPIIITEVSNGVLHLKSLRGYSASELIILRISVTNLEGLSVSGAGKIDIEGLNNERFEIDSSGAPTIRASGVTKVVDIDSSGAAKIDTRKLQASRAVVESSGVSKIDIDVKDQLDVTISGPSQVPYEGDPVVNKTVNGPGKLQKKATEGT